MGVIVWILGPAPSSETNASASTRAVHHGHRDDVTGTGADLGSRNDAVSLENARPNTHKAFWMGGERVYPLDLGSGAGAEHRFLGQKAFPEQFRGWGDPPEDDMMPVVVNTVDVRPLGASLPKADILLAILSGASEVMGSLMIDMCMRIAKCSLRCYVQQRQATTGTNSTRDLS